PEDLEQLLVARLGWVKDHTHGFGVAGLARARLLVSRIGGAAALVAPRRRPHAGLLPERLFLAPEAAQREFSDLEPFRIWPGDGCAEHAVRPRVWQDGVA